jgi:signal transduction histidine kinase
VRLHPLHARQGADVPGFAFPLRFRVQTATAADFSDATTLFENLAEDYPNPGNNAVVIPALGKTARHVRVTMLAPQKTGRDTFALSELEVYAGGKNVSRGAAVQSSGDPRRDVPRPLSLLTDGHTSYGRLLELPDWLAQWEKREALSEKAAALEKQITDHMQTAQHRAILSGVAGVLGIIALLVGMFWRSQARHRREQREFRNQLARDMHDEIGSNLAGIAVISETSALQADATSQDWQEINRIAHETTDAMREVLWLVGARQESGIDLMEHLQHATKRLLPNHEVRWLSTAPDLPLDWPVESRRQVFLFFKEAVTNILKHAKATKVEFSANVESGILTMTIRDNGQGFNPGSHTHGIGLESLRERAKTLSGTCEITSTPKGSTICLHAPLKS